MAQVDDFYGLSWTAIPTTDVDTVLDVLGLKVSKQTTVSFGGGRDGLPAICSSKSNQIACVVQGDWTYLFGYQMGLAGRAQKVSETFGRAIAIENEQKLGAVLCSVEKDGKTVRQLSELQCVFNEDGEALPDEPDLTPIDECVLSDDRVIALSRAWGADPLAISEGAPMTLLKRATGPSEMMVIVGWVLFALLVIGLLIWHYA